MLNTLPLFQLARPHQRATALSGSGWLLLFATLGVLAMPEAYAYGASSHPSTNHTTQAVSADTTAGTGNSLHGGLNADGLSSRHPSASTGWHSYLQQLRHYVAQQPAVAAEQARLQAAKAALAAQQGDLNLNLTGSYVYYPNGTGSSNGGTSTNLTQRAELRLSWGVLGFLTRRPGRIQHARASVQQQKYESRITRLKTTKALLNQAITAWAADRRRTALQRSLDKVSEARDKLRLASRASQVTRATGATPEQVAAAASLQRRIQTRLASVPQVTTKVSPIPENYAVLPLQAPPREVIQNMARNAATAKSYRAKSRAASGKAQSYWGNGIDLNIYGGYTVEKRQNVGGFENGPEVGLKLTIPIGTAASNKAAAAAWRAKAMQLQAKAATAKRSRYLHQLRQQWVADVAALKAAKSRLQHRADLLQKMQTRAQHPASGKAPEPWELDLQAARFWLSVAKVWNQRRQWMQDALTWSLYDPGYLQQAGRPRNSGAGSSLCAPLPSCKQITG